MLKLDVCWGTHIEIIAFATYFKSPVYIAQEYVGPDHYTWQAIKPLQSVMRYPVIVDDVPPINKYTHFEISYENMHYNSVVDKDGMPTLLNNEPVITLCDITNEIHCS